jgi:hypothetical protein
MLNKRQIQKSIQSKTDLSVIKFLQKKLKIFEEKIKDSLENKREKNFNKNNLFLHKAKHQKEKE